MLESVRNFLLKIELLSEELLESNKGHEYMKKYKGGIDAFQRKRYEKAIKLLLEAKELAKELQKEKDGELNEPEIKKEKTDIEIEKYPDIDNGVYLTNQNWEIFKNFIGNTNKSLDIMTNVISAKTSLLLLNLLKKRNVKIRILTRRILKVDFNKLMELKNDSKFDLEICRCARLHAKVFIRDGKKAIIGSPNFTYTSIGEEERNGYVEGYYVTDNKEILKSTKSFFNSIWSEKDITINSDRFLTSKRGGIPKKIIEMIKSEKKELFIVMNSSLIQLNIIDDIVEKFNKNLRLKIITNWPRETNTGIKEVLYKLRDYSNLKTKELEIVPKRQNIHAKIYIFKSKKLAFISSMNLHRNSWTTSFEAGVILKDKKEIEELSNYIDSLETIESEDITTNDDVGLTLEESEEADRQAASVIQTKKIPFPLEGENWQTILSKSVRKGIQKFEKALKKLYREGRKDKGDHLIGEKESKFIPSGAPHSEAHQAICRYCKERFVVIYTGSDGLCSICRKKLERKGEYSKVTAI